MVQNLKQQPMRGDASSTKISNIQRYGLILFGMVNHCTGLYSPIFCLFFLPQVVYLLLDFAVHTTAEYVSVTEGVASKTLFVPSVEELHC